MQDMLENKIASLVETIRYADSAEKQFLMKEVSSSKDLAILKALDTLNENLKNDQQDKKNVCITFIFQVVSNLLAPH